MPGPGTKGPMAAAQAATRPDMTDEEKRRERQRAVTRSRPPVAPPPAPTRGLDVGAPEVLPGPFGRLRGRLRAAAAQEPGAPELWGWGRRGTYGQPTGAGAAPAPAGGAAPAWTPTAGGGVPAAGPGGRRRGPSTLVGERRAEAAQAAGATLPRTPPPPTAPGPAAGGEGRITPESIGEDWVALGFGSADEGARWAEEFAAEHGGKYPWEEGTMSPAANLQEHVAALRWGQGFQASTGRAPTEGDYRIEWYKSRFGLGPNWNIEGASRGGGMGFMPREYMGG